WIPAGVEEHKHGTNMVPRGDRQKLVNPLLETFCILLPEKVVQKDAHGVHAQAFGPSQFSLDLGRIEGCLLPHLQLVDRGLWNVVASDEPGLSRVPIIRLLLWPSHSLCRNEGCIQADGAQDYSYENKFETHVQTPR